jgi:hypothetical protein
LALKGVLDGRKSEAGGGKRGVRFSGKKYFFKKCWQLKFFNLHLHSLYEKRLSENDLRGGVGRKKGGVDPTELEGAVRRLKAGSSLNE